MVEFGEQLRRAREAKGMTQQSLAEQLYVTRQSVSRWECGDRYPDLLTTTKIAKLLDVSLDDLLSGKEMEKVVERNPVVENKAVNNIMIALYSVVVLSLIAPALDGILRHDFSEIGTANSIVTLVIFAFKLFSFIYGLVNAIRGTLSPKRMGAVIGAFFTAMVISGAVTIFTVFPISALNTDANKGNMMPALVLFVIELFPGIAGIIGTYFYFIKNKNHSVWPALITFASIAGIATSLIGNLTVLSRYSDMYSLSQTLSLILNIAVYALIIYQTFTLRIKRKKAKETVSQ